MPDAPVTAAVTAAAARSYLTGRLSLTDLEAVLRDLYGDAYLAGAHAAAQGGVTLSAGLGEADASVDWAAWTPGNPAAADLLSEGGLSSLLDSAGITIQGMTGTALDQLGNALADGLNSGASTDTIAGTLSGLLDSRAQAVAVTETARAVTQASLGTYADAGVAQFDWITSDGACPDCEAESDGNPHDLGDDAPPGHPSCRCCASPVVPAGGLTPPPEEGN
jgi:SPP1 gp7 family putative phage head morphogenesis protein